MHKILMGRKASEVFLEYCEPLLWVFAHKEVKNLKGVKKGLGLPLLLWNAVVLDGVNKSPFSWVQKVRNNIREADSDAEEFLDFWIKRKKEDFGKYKYTISDFYLLGKDISDCVMRVEIRDPKKINIKDLVNLMQ